MEPCDYKTLWLGFYINNDLSEYQHSNTQNHLTLLFCGNLEKYTTNQIDALKIYLKDFCSQIQPLEGNISGVCRFTSAGKDVVCATVDVPYIEDLKYMLSKGLESCGISSPRDHGFIPHITLDFINSEDVSFVNKMKIQPLYLDTLVLDCGEKIYFTLGKNI